LASRGRLRGLLVLGVAGALALGLLEVGARTLVPALRGPAFAPPALRHSLERVAALDDPQPLQQANAPGWSRHYLLHPYLGYVRDPEAPPELAGGERAPLPANAWGFFGPPPVQPAREGRATVAVLGGSFALELVLFAGDALREALAARPAFAGREIEIVSLALEGVKQPQQLLGLQYVLALGGHFDLVVNLDGFNEVVLPLTDNEPFGVALHYPRAWPLFASRGLDTEVQALLGQVATATAARRERAVAVAGSWRSRSAVGLLLWSTADAADAARVEEHRARLRERLQASRERRSLQELGPPDAALGGAGLAQAVALWRRGSEELARLCDSHGISYAHFLQPNQYYPRGRAFTAWERRHTLAEPGHRYRVRAEAGYPALIEAGAALSEAGVRFVDLTGLFRDDPETVYRDACCHLNPEGYAKVARAIAAALE
jgi:hypothetical protein